MLRLLDWTISGGGFIKGDRIIGVLKDLIGETNIEDLPIPYTAVAVDLDVQREVWFSHGPLFDAIRASIAIPTIFRPYHYEGRLLVDGGLLNPLPISPTLRDLTDCTIAVDINAPAEPLHGIGEATASGDNSAEFRSRRGGAGVARDAARWRQTGAGRHPARRLSQAHRRIHRRHDRKARAQQRPRASPVRSSCSRARSIRCRRRSRGLKLAAEPPDLLITIPRNACAFYEFHRADELIEIGRQRTREALARWHRPTSRSGRVEHD